MGGTEFGWGLVMDPVKHAVFSEISGGSPLAKDSTLFYFFPSRLCHKFSGAAFIGQIFGMLLDSIINFGSFFSCSLTVTLYPMKTVSRYTTFYSTHELYHQKLTDNFTFGRKN